MESSSTSSGSKTAINILIGIATLLTILSVISVLSKDGAHANNILKENEQVSLLQENTATTTELALDISTTTQMNEVASSTEAVANLVASSTVKETLLGKTWVWVSTVVDGKKSLTPKKESAFTLIMKDNGSIAGTTDCNAFFGTYTKTEDTLRFGPLGSTKKFCDGSQEMDFLTSLQDISTYTFDAHNNLIFISKSGTSTMTFK